MLAIFYPIDAAHLLFRLIILGTIFYPLPQAFALDMNFPNKVNFKDKSSKPSNFYLFFPDSRNAMEAWELLLGREPRTFLWKDVTNETSFDRLTGFDFSKGLISKRRSLGIKHEFFSIHQKEKGLLFTLGDLEYYLVIENNKPLILHIILKLILNTLSTLVMGKLGRFQGNLMTWVRPSNNKLIDRAIRYSQLLLKEKGIIVSYENIARACFITLEQEHWNRSLVMEIVKRVEGDCRKNLGKCV